MSRFGTPDSFNTGSVGATSSAVFDRPIPNNYSNVAKIKVVPSGSTTGWKLEIFKNAACSGLPQWSTKNAVIGNFYDPSNRSGAEVLEGFIIPYEDLDGGQELHYKITNLDGVSRSYDITTSFDYSYLAVGDGLIELIGSRPQITFNDEDSTPDEKVWDIVVDSSQMHLRMRSDDDLTTKFILSLDRSGGGATSIGVVTWKKSDHLWNGDGAGSTAALATNAASGFQFITGCAGTPTGTPNVYTGAYAMVFDSTNKKICVNVAGTWYKTATLT